MQQFLNINYWQIEWHISSVSTILTFATVHEVCLLLICMASRKHSLFFNWYTIEVIPTCIVLDMCHDRKVVYPVFVACRINQYKVKKCTVHHEVYKYTEVKICKTLGHYRSHTAFTYPIIIHLPLTVQPTNSLHIPCELSCFISNCCEF